MDNELDKINGNRNLPDQISEQIGMISNAVQVLQHEMQKNNAEQNEKMEQLKTVFDQQLDKTSKIEIDGYCIKTILGEGRNPEISAQRMTKLLRTVGIVKEVNSNPYQRFMKGKIPLCTKIVKSTYIQYVFQYIRTWRVIDRWLKKHDQYFDFYNCITKDEIDAFIDYLHEHRVEFRGVIEDDDLKYDDYIDHDDEFRVN
jgi:hypothetical protein